MHDGSLLLPSSTTFVMRAVGAHFWRISRQIHWSGSIARVISFFIFWVDTFSFFYSFADLPASAKFNAKAVQNNWKRVLFPCHGTHPSLSLQSNGPSNNFISRVPDLGSADFEDKITKILNLPDSTSTIYPKFKLRRHPQAGILHTTRVHKGFLLHRILLRVRQVWIQLIKIQCFQISSPILIFEYRGAL